MACRRLPRRPWTIAFAPYLSMISLCWFQWRKYKISLACCMEASTVDYPAFPSSLDGLALLGSVEEVREVSHEIAIWSEQ